MFCVLLHSFFLIFFFLSTSSMCSEPNVNLFLQIETLLLSVRGYLTERLLEHCVEFETADDQTSFAIAARQ